MARCWRKWIFLKKIYYNTIFCRRKNLCYLRGWGTAKLDRSPGYYSDWVEVIVVLVGSSSALTKRPSVQLLMVSMRTSEVVQNTKLLHSSQKINVKPKYGHLFTIPSLRSIRRESHLWSTVLNFSRDLAELVIGFLLQPPIRNLSRGSPWTKTFKY